MWKYVKTCENMWEHVKICEKTWKKDRSGPLNFWRLRLVGLGWGRFAKSGTPCGSMTWFSSSGRGPNRSSPCLNQPGCQNHHGLPIFYVAALIFCCHWRSQVKLMMMMMMMIFIFIFIFILILFSAVSSWKMRWSVKPRIKAPEQPYDGKVSELTVAEFPEKFGEGLRDLGEENRSSGKKHRFW